jgi:hypothetical protein
MNNDQRISATARAENAVGKNPNLMQLPYGIGLYPSVHIK